MSSTSTPSTMSAMVAGEGQAPSKEQISTPTPKSNQALVQVAYAAQNPTDGTRRNGFFMHDRSLTVSIQSNPLTVQRSVQRLCMVSSLRTLC